MDAACVREGQAGETSQEHCSSPRDRTALSGHNTFLRNHAAAETPGECHREQRAISEKTPDAAWLLFVGIQE